MDSSSPWEQHDGSEDEQGESDSDRQGQGKGSPSQSRRPHHTALGARQAVATLVRTLPSRGRLLNESNAVLESSEGKSGKKKSRSSKEPGPRISRQPKGLHSRYPKSRRREIKQNLSRAYRDLLNADIEDARRRSSGKAVSLDSSQIGRSYWTAHEKDCLFRRIERTGLRDLKDLNQAVPTKSDAEIKAYLLLLDESLSSSATYGTSTEQLDMSDVPAASEVPSDLESALDAAATALECHVHDHDVKAEQKVNGDVWLIDIQAADQIELEYEISHEQQGNAENELDNTSAAAGHAPAPASLAAATKPESLLRPAALLELSSNLFMNNGEDEEQNWHHLDALSTDIDGPAMFRSALTDLHDLAIGLTRRLVQVVIFQAMSRLRAEDSIRKDWTPSANIRDADVHSALDLLNMPRSGERYWASCARRCRVDVYSESKKFADGRPGTKQGRRLTFDEVETELRLDLPHIDTDGNVNNHFDAEDVDEMLRDDEMFTDVSEVDSPPKDNSEYEEPAKPTRRRSSKRKRALSPADFCRVETAYLEAVDRNTRTTEEMRLRKLLRIEAVDDADVSRSLLASEPGPVPAALIGDLKWRERVEYEAEWEHLQGHVGPEAFHQMALAGKAGRQRRRILHAELQRRLGEDIALPLKPEDELASEEEQDIEEDLDDGEDEDEVSSDHSDE